MSGAVGSSKIVIGDIYIYIYTVLWFDGTVQILTSVYGVVELPQMGQLNVPLLLQQSPHQREHSTISLNLKMHTTFGD